MSERNKTINTTVENGQRFLSRCKSINCKVEDLESYINSTIIGDTIEAMCNMPNECIDLIIADPPYNLSKNYNGTTFNKMSDSDYKLYTEEWVKLAYNVLKPNGTMYVYCDWKSSLIRIV